MSEVTQRLLVSYESAKRRAEAVQARTTDHLTALKMTFRIEHYKRQINSLRRAAGEVR